MRVNFENIFSKFARLQHIIPVSQPHNSWEVFCGKISICKQFSTRYLTSFLSKKYAGICQWTLRTYLASMLEPCLINSHQENFGTWRKATERRLTCLAGLFVLFHSLKLSFHFQKFCFGILSFLCVCVCVFNEGLGISWSGDFCTFSLGMRKVYCRKRR